MSDLDRDRCWCGAAITLDARECCNGHPTEEEAATLSRDDLHARLDDVVSQIAALGIEIEGLIDVTAAGKGGPGITSERHVLVNKRAFLYREEVVLRRHLRHTRPPSEMEQQIALRDEKITLLENKLRQARHDSQPFLQQLRELQALRARTKATTDEAFRAGVNHERGNSDRLVAILHAVANGDEKVIAAVRTCFTVCKRPLPPVVIGENGRFARLDRTPRGAPWKDGDT